MSKNKIEVASVLSFEKKLVPSDAFFYGTQWSDRKNAEPLALIEKSVRGTISNRLKPATANDPLKLNTEVEKAKIQKCYNCIKTCNVANTPYCITKALINAVKGNMKEALVFCGSNVDKVKEIVSVHTLMNELVSGIE